MCAYFPHDQEYQKFFEQLLLGADPDATSRLDDSLSLLESNTAVSLTVVPATVKDLRF